VLRVNLRPHGGKQTVHSRRYGVPIRNDAAGRGITTKTSPYSSVSETLERLRETVREKGLDVIALIGQ
jgi:hypothetical protein